MAGRPVTIRLRVEGHLELCTPLHVGGLGYSPDVDLPVATDGASRVYVPGTSLAGVFRDWLAGAGSTDAPEVRALWGYAQDFRGHASRVVVRDALVLGADGSSPLPASRLETRPSVGIDRRTGAAAHTILFSRAVVPMGCQLGLELDVESDPTTVALDRARLGALLRALAAGDVTLGAATTRGLGRVRLAPGVRVTEHDLGSRDGLIALLRGTSPSRVGLGPDTLPGDPERTGRSLLDVTIDWRPLAPVMVRSERAGAVLDTLPLTTADGAGDVRLTLPGSSVKGALRAHAARILRTLSGVRAPARTVEAAAALDDAAAFRAQLDQLPLVAALFGAAPTAADGTDGTTTGSPGRPEGASTVYEVPIDPRAPMVPVTEPPSVALPSHDGDREPALPARRVGVGALQVMDCRSVTAISAADWCRLILAPRLSGADRDLLAQAGIAQADHVAIDRWTGGAADARLFTVAEPWAVRWEPIRMRVDRTRLGADADLAMALLLLVLRELRDGWVPLGGATTRGFGDITAEITVTAEGTVHDLDAYLAGPDGQRIRAAWQRHWQAEPQKQTESQKQTDPREQTEPPREESA